MTKKDYIVIADIFKKAIQDNKNDENANGKIGLINGLIYDFCLMFATDNPRFNDKRFIDYINGNDQKKCIDCQRPATNGNKCDRCSISESFA